MNNEKDDMLSEETRSFSLDGKLALITGASSGIGRYLAGVLGRAGASVVLAARRKAVVAEEAARLREQGGQAVGIAMNVAETESIDTAFDEIHKLFGRRPDILVNCAGVALLKPFLEQTPEELDVVIGTNLRGAFLVAQRAARAMAEQGGGAIINVASTAGLRPGGMLSSYGATKAGLIHLSKVMAYELARNNIRVNALCPGNIETEMHREFEDAGFAQALVKRIPQRRFGQCKDLAGATLLLASDAGAYMTGTVLTVDGGQIVNSI
ncbi:glucose 1-dehydrogenase [Pollutimonas sp. H1-120]|uniref:SDR family NAD(P)-dependent oxidoreductase n=1 Tax=Pollutimonas sp. H1-120 TaxID=3148824 RepID=UPI003B52EDC3